MPLEQNIRTQIATYCAKDLPGDVNWHIELFDFIAESDLELKKRLGRAFYSARYMAKLMEATYAENDELHAFVKFQIIQYASIYEAVVVYLLREIFKEHEEVKKLCTHKAYKKMNALGSKTTMHLDGEELHTCVYRDARTPWHSISFGDKVDCAVRIGFLEEKYAEDIKTLYVLRNLAHLETEAEKEIEVQIEQSKNGYWRLKPFLERVSEFMRQNKTVDTTPTAAP